MLCCIRLQTTWAEGFHSHSIGNAQTLRVLHANYGRLGGTVHAGMKTLIMTFPTTIVSWRVVAVMHRIWLSMVFSQDSLRLRDAATLRPMYDSRNHLFLRSMKIKCDDFVSI